MLKKRIRNWSPPRILLASFAVLTLAGTLLLMLPISLNKGSSDFMVALFTSTSAVTVTGLATVDVSSYFSEFGHLVILVLLQLGGLGVMTFSSLLVILIGKRLTFNSRRILQEDLNHDRMGGIAGFIKQLIRTVFVVEGIGAVILTLAFWRHYPFFEALKYGVFHSVSAFCNAGFSLFSDSLMSFNDDPFILIPVAFLILFGGAGFGVLTGLLSWRPGKQMKLKLSLTHKLAVRASLILVIYGMFMFWFLESHDQGAMQGMGFVDKAVNAFFQSVTTRTAGFNSVDLTLINPATTFLFLLLMFIGASPGSTGGGVKTTTLAVIAAAVKATIRRQEDIEFGNRRIPWQILNRCIAIVSISLVFIVTMTFLVLIVERTKLSSVLFEVVSAFGTVGLSVGITPELGVISQILIMITMFVGRVGPLTFALALGEKRQSQSYRYPSENIIVG